LHWTNIEIWKPFLLLEYLSNIELYVSTFINEDEKYLEISGDESHHAVIVMRNKVGDKIFATNGSGKIFECKIIDSGKENLKAAIIKSFIYKNESDNFTFCIPNLKNPERLKFALEKSIEIGITNFIIFNSERTISKNINIERLKKISIAAMKQSLHSYLPVLETAKSVKDLLKHNYEIILFDQSSNLTLDKYKFNNKKKYLFIFGPEGSLSNNELKVINANLIFNLGNYRLRTETAIVKSAALLSVMIKNDSSLL